MIKTLNQRRLETIKSLKSQIEKFKEFSEKLNSTNTEEYDKLAVLNKDQTNELSTAKEKVNELQQRDEENKKLITNFEDEISRLEKENKQLRIKLKQLKL